MIGFSGRCEQDSVREKDTVSPVSLSPVIEEETLTFH